MNIYHDNNIVASIEKGEYSLKDIQNLLPKEKAVYFYSSAHIFEAETFQESHVFSIEQFRKNGFQTLREIFRQRYLFIDRGNIAYIL